jgi:hypothetical protein
MSKSDGLYHLLLRIIAVRHAVKVSSLTVFCSRKYAENMLNVMANRKYVTIRYTASGPVAFIRPEGDRAATELSMDPAFTDMDFEKYLNMVPPYEAPVKGKMQPAKAMPRPAADGIAPPSATPADSGGQPGLAGGNVDLPDGPSAEELSWAIGVLAREYARRGQEHIFSEAKRMRNLWETVREHEGRINIKWGDKK